MDDGTPRIQANGQNNADPTSRAITAGMGAFGAGWEPTVRAAASGRIELIGNHLDYNGGPVLAAAIDREIVVLRQNAGESDTVTVVLADESNAPVTLATSDLPDWRNPNDHIEPIDYVRAVLASLQSRGHGWEDGAQIAVAGDVPVGLGVSSSAALCVGLCLALSGAPLSAQERVLTAQEAEHRAGTPCGTMDQSASVAGGVIRFDGATLGVQKLEPNLGQFTFLIADSGVDRSLGSSSYPRRVAESKEALALVNAALPESLPYLAAMTADQLSWLADRGVLIETLLRRCRHIVSETARVSEAEAAMNGGDWSRFGSLMTASGRSSAVDYDVSHPRVEELVADILDAPGVQGARMMGGGDGGSVLALLEESTVEQLEARLRGGYFQRYGLVDRQDAIERCKFGPAASLTEMEHADKSDG